jgi:glutathione S-transferase
LVLDRRIDFSSADAPEKIPYAINRYQTETKRLYQVLNDRLASERKINNIPEGEAAYLVGNKYTLSDICVFSWGKSNCSRSMLVASCVAS